MGTLNLLQTVNQCQDELGLSRSNAVVSAQDMQTRQFLAFANKVGRDLIREFEWRKITLENVFQTTASRSGTCLVSSANTLTGFSSASSLCATGDVVSGSGIPLWAQVTVVTETALTLNVNCTGTASATTSCSFSQQFYPLPAGFDRQLSSTQWNRQQIYRPMAGNTSAQEWAWLKGGIVTTPGLLYFYRLSGERDGQPAMQIHPPPTQRMILANQYISNRWVSSTTAATPSLASFAADTDLPVFNDDIMVNGIKFHFLKANGLDYATTLAEFARSVSYGKSQDSPAPTLSLAPERGDFLIGPGNIPPTGFGLP